MAKGTTGIACYRSLLPQPRAAASLTPFLAAALPFQPRRCWIDFKAAVSLTPDTGARAFDDVKQRLLSMTRENPISVST